ncbi:hypothetical protein ACIG56_27295 [Nocardia fusca]|uniref:hypothetical protein n=1 Tax=Nocardia fusca TaxID=941183 RepID=UPI0037C8017D
MVIPYSPSSALNSRPANPLSQISPVREALRDLEGQGLVITSPQQERDVAPLTHDECTGPTRLRRRIEPEIAGRAAALLREKNLPRINC